MKVMAVKCLKCGDTIYSRAQHDFHYCSCKSVGIDGGRQYTRIIGDIKDIQEKQINIKASQKELYEDWNLKRDKYGLIISGDDSVNIKPKKALKTKALKKIK